MTRERIELGKQAEAAVATLLRQQGYTICAQNYKNRAGEIDIIASYEDVLVFVEVKVRRSQLFNLSVVVNYPKQKKIVKTALAYIWTNNITGMSYRFDVALLEISPAGGYTMSYIAHAFTAPETQDFYFES